MSPIHVRTIRFVSIVVLLNVAAFTMLGILVNRALDGIDRNVHRIAVANWQTCNDFNRGFQRQNTVIDEAIAAERAKPNPDATTINNLIRFRLPERECGPRP